MAKNLKLFLAVTGLMIIPSFSGFNNSVHAADENNGWFIPKGSQTKPVINTPKTVKHSTANVSKAVPVASVPDTDDSDETDMQNQNQPVLPLPPIPTPARTMTSEQIQSRARQLQARVLKAQKDFRNRSRIIQEAAQVSFGQIERELIQIIQNVASSHNMNLVLHREQVALSVNELDITNDVLKELNKNLPSVFVPAANVDPEELAKSGTMPTTANPEPQKPQTKAVEPKKTTK